MTKRNLLLVSLFLVLGLVAMTTSALASSWAAGSGINKYGRAEGLAEETGYASLAVVGGGSVALGSTFTFVYPGVTVLPGTPTLTCSSTAGATDVWYVSQPACADVSATLSGTNTVVVTFTATETYQPGDSIALVVRVDASTIASTSLPYYVYPQITAYDPNGTLTIGTASIVSVGPVLIVNKAPALSLTIANKDWQVGAYTGLPADVLSCIGVEEVKPWDNTFVINVDEEFPNALTTESWEYKSDPGSASPGYVTNGTTFTVTFSDVPKGVWIGDATVTPCVDLLTTDPSYCAGGTLTVGPGVETYASETGTAANPVYSISFTFTTATEDSGIAYTKSGLGENMDIWFHVTSHGAPIAPGYGPITANITLGPTKPSTDIPLFTGALELTTPINVVDFSDCQTFLLFPYVTDEDGWDTGIAVANTTLDPFATDPNLSPYLGRGAAKPQTGPITFYTYSGGTQHTYLTPTSVVPGSAYTTDVATIAPPNAVSGYIIAVCDFQNAHGYAIVLANFGLGDAVAANYIATVLPNPEWYPRFPAGDYIGESAIAPGWVDPKQPTNPKH